jgi:hypothetical protein
MIAPGGNAMDEIVNLVAQKVGLPADKAQMAVNVILNHLKSKAPALSGPLDQLLSGGDGGGAGGLADVAGSLGGLGDMFKK